MAIAISDPTIQAPPPTTASVVNAMTATDANSPRNVRCTDSPSAWDSIPYMSRRGETVASKRYFLQIGHGICSWA